MDAPPSAAALSTLRYDAKPWHPVVSNGTVSNLDTESSQTAPANARLSTTTKLRPEAELWHPAENTVPTEQPLEWATAEMTKATPSDAASATMAAPKIATRIYVIKV